MQFSDENSLQDNKINPNIFLPVIRQHFLKTRAFDQRHNQCNLTNICDFCELKMKSTKYFTLIFTVMVSMCLANEELDEFVKLFQQKRLVQLSAIKQLLNMNPTRCLIYKCTNFWRSCLSSYLNVQISSVFRVISFFQKSFESSKCLFFIHFGLLFASK